MLTNIRRKHRRSPFSPNRQRQLTRRLEALENRLYLSVEPSNWAVAIGGTGDEGSSQALTVDDFGNAYTVASIETGPDTGVSSATAYVRTRCCAEERTKSGSRSSADQPGRPQPS